MPEETQTPTLPPWYFYTVEETIQHFDDLADNGEVLRCDCCGDVYLLRRVPTPDFVDSSSPRSDRLWVRADTNSGNNVDVLLRYDWLSASRSVTIAWRRDASYSAIDEYYDYVCEGCHDSLAEREYEAENEQNEDNSEYVHDYGYRPRVIFFDAVSDGVGSSRHASLAALGLLGRLSPASYNGETPVQKPYFGFELEMTREESDMSVDSAARYMFDRVDSFAYMKWDGSVERGIELVTHPHTLEAYNNRQDLWDAIEHLRSHGWRSWKSSSSCGLHIHINNASFSSVGHAMRFLMFVYKNREPLVRFAGRDSHYARFDFDQFVQREVHAGYNDDGSPRYEIGTVADVVKKKQMNDSRYLAVNCQNTNTYELRFFRGNMNTNAVRACLEFVAALHEYTENLTSHDCLVNRALTWRPFLAFVRHKSGQENFRYRRLHERLTMATRNGDSGFINTGGAE
jgi:hypothetical protein